jgi:hypothetical protein
MRKERKEKQKREKEEKKEKEKNNTKQRTFVGENGENESKLEFEKDVSQT